MTGPVRPTGPRREQPVNLTGAYDNRAPQRRGSGAGKFIAGTATGLTLAAALGGAYLLGTQHDGPTQDPKATPAPTTGAPDLKQGAGEQITKSEWPTTAAEAAAQMGLSADAAKYLVKGDNNAWNAEFFPFKDGVTYVNGKHMKDGKEITDRDQIFKFQNDDGSYVTPEWQTLTNKSGNGVLWARSGGAAGNLSRYMAPSDLAVDKIEQAALIPSPELCKNDPDTAAWRNAITEFVYNEQAQQHVITVEWYNPETKKLQVIDGRTISSYAETMSVSQKDNFAAVLRTLPMNYPLTPEQAVAMSGSKTQPKEWSFDITNGKWTYEGFKLADGVGYDEAGGVLRKGSQIISGDAAYNFKDWDSSLWATTWTFPTQAGVYGYVRTGGGSNFEPGTNYYGIGGTITTNGVAGFEQGGFIPVKPRTDCTAQSALAIQMAGDVQARVADSNVDHVAVVDPQSNIKHLK